MAKNRENDSISKDEPVRDYKVEVFGTVDPVNYPGQALSNEISFGVSQPIVEYGSVNISGPSGVKDEPTCGDWLQSATPEPEVSCSTYQQQMDQDTGSNEGQVRPHYTCHVCGYSFNILANLKRHMMIIHCGEKPFGCNVCDFRTNHTGSLKSHMLKHSNEKPYMCTLCDYKSNLSGSLKRHMMSHTGEKPHACTVCDVKFTQAITLRNHMRIHTGEKPYICTVCNHKFTQSIHLKTHMVIHTGEKPYSCSLCDYRCSLPHKLRAHMKTHPEMSTAQ